MSVDYFVLSTYPADGSGNIGDYLITSSAVELLRRVKGQCEVEVLFREEDLSPYLTDINRSRALLMPGFAIRDPIHPNTYRLTPRLEAVGVPLIPIGAGAKFFPGDFASCSVQRFSKPTQAFLRWIAQGLDSFACREYLTCALLKAHGITNPAMVGDCAWYHLPSLGTPLKRPERVDRLVFTTPHSRLYVQQAKNVMKMLAGLFPESELICCLQSRPSDGVDAVVQWAKRHGFSVIQGGGKPEMLELYGEIDLHVGYRVHGHLASLARRRPSVLLCEDSRGAGFSYSLGGGGFHAFQRTTVGNLLATSKLRDSGVARRACHMARFKEATAEADLAARVKQFLLEEMQTGWRRYVGIPHVIDETYREEMEPFLQCIP